MSGFAPTFVKTQVRAKKWTVIFWYGPRTVPGTKEFSAVPCGREKSSDSNALQGKTLDPVCRDGIIILVLHLVLNLVRKLLYGM